MRRMTWTGHLRRPGSDAGSVWTGHGTQGGCSSDSQEEQGSSPASAPALLLLCQCATGHHELQTLKVLDCAVAVVHGCATLCLAVRGPAPASQRPLPQPPAPARPLRR
jgi:hypothetical protein